MIIENNKKKSVWRRVATRLFIFLLAGSFLFCSSVKAAVTGDYNKSINGTLSSSEWNNLIKDFISVNGGRIDGSLGINTATSSFYALDISGAVRATTFTGSYSGTLNSGNVSAGAFGSNTGGGNYTFPGNVGIGTTAPGLKLDVQTAGYGLPMTTGSAQTYGGIRISPPSGYGNVVLDMGTNGGVGTWLQSTLRSDLSLTYPILLNPNGGSVGIGTTTTGAYKLFVNGTANFTGTVSAGSFSGPMSGTLSSGNVSAGIFGSNTGGGNYAFTGNLGIGTTNPGAKFEVYNNATYYATTLAAVNNPNIAFRIKNRATINTALGIGAIGSIDKTGIQSFDISDNSAKDILLNPFGGNVGIGTTNPGEKLEVDGDAYIAGSGSTIGGGNIANSTLRIGSTLGIDPNEFYFSGLDGYIGTIGAYGLNFTTNGSNVRMKIDSSGNVGIGTTNPSTAKLVVTPSGSYSIDASGGRIGNITSVNDTDAASVAYVKAVVGGTSTIPTVGYWTQNGSNIYNANGGGVAIGTTTPGSYKLFVNGNANINGVLSANSFSGPLAGTVNSTNVSAGAFAANTGGGNFSFPGNVGIGTAGPHSLLEVSSNVNAELTLNRQGNWAASPADIKFSANNAVTDYWVLGMLANSTNNFYLNKNASNYFTVLEANGNVGIGTTTPSQKLDVNGNANVSGTVTAGSFSGPLSGTLSSGNVSAGAFGSNTGGGNYSFPANVGIGTTNPGAKLDVVGGNIDIDNTTFANQNGIITKNGTRFIHDFNYGNNGTVTTTGGNIFVGLYSGNFTMGSTATDASQASYNTVVGYYSLKNNTTGFNNSSLGGYSLTSNTTGYANSAIGLSSLYSNTTGGSNSAFGNYSLYSNVAGNNGTAIGYESQRYVNSTTTAWTNTNTSVGVQSLRGSATAANNTGNNNSAFGYQTLLNNTTGSNNSALGYSSLQSNTTGSNNSASGFDSLYSNTTGNNNSAFGFDSLYYNTTGNNNSALGLNSGRYIADGSTANQTSNNSIYLGYNARAYANGDTNETVIGYNAVGIGSNSVVLGNDSVTTTALKGNVGIGTTTVGSYKLFVNGTANFTGTVSAGSFSGPLSGTLSSGNVSAGTFGSNTGGGNYAFTGNVGIGTTNPSVKLHVYNAVDGAFNGLAIDNRKTYGAGTGVNETSKLILSLSEGAAPDPTSRIFGYMEAGTNSESSSADGWLALGSRTSGTATEKLRIASTGNVGIGTTAPAYGLSVNSPLGINVYGGTANLGRLVFGDPVDNKGYIGIYRSALASSTAEGYGLTFGSISGFSFTTPNGSGNTFANQVERLRIQSDGSVGIGTTTPTSAKLVITPSGSYSIDAGGGRVGNITSVADTDAASVAYVKAVVGGTSTIPTVGYWTASGNNIYNANGGGVAIGTTTPGSYKLFVNGNANINGTLSASSFSGPLTGTVNSTNVSAGAFAANTGGGNFSFPGNVGIGTTNPLNTLHVLKTSGGLESIPLLLQNRDSTNGTAVSMDWSVNGSDIITGKITNIKNTTNDYSLKFGTYSYPDSLNIRNGSVGIGTTTPSQKLDVVGNANFSGTVTAGSFSGPMSGTLSSGNVSAGIFGSNTGGGNYSFTGNVGVGTNAPTGRLGVYANSSTGVETNSIAFDSGGSELGSIRSYNDGGYFQDMRFYVSNGTSSPALFNALTIKGQTGNVGIGITNPTAKLFVAGDISTDHTNGRKIGFNINDSFTPSGGFNTAHYGLTVDSFGTNTVALSGYSGLGFFTLGTERMRVSQGGFVGIGTTSPAYKLDVNGDVHLTGTLYAGALSGGAMTGTINSANVSSGTFGSNTGGGNFSLLGNFGIGTTNPTAKLDVVGGNIDIDNTTFVSQTGIITKNGTRFIHDFNYGNNGTVTTDGANTFVGRNAGNFSMGSTATLTYQASYNSALGIQSLQNNTTGSHNSALGAYSLYNNTTGVGNSALGQGSLQNNTTGGANSTLGQTSLYSNITGSYNSALGNAALYSNIAGNNGTALGYESQRNVNSTTTAWTNTNTSVGYQSLRGSGTAANNTGNANTAIGYQSLLNNTTGSNNSAVGIYALQNNTTGSGNSALGNGALITNTTGSHNSAFGVNTLQYNTTGNFNSAFGREALNYITTGGGNVAHGYNAGRYISNGTTANQTSSNSIYLGYNTKALADGDANETVIGYNAVGIGSNSVVLGNDSVTTTALKGNVGIGTTTPGSYKLFVNGTAKFTGTVTAGSFSGPLSGTLSSGNVSAGAFGSNTGGGNYTFPGNVGIGTTAPLARFHISDSGVDKDGFNAANGNLIIQANTGSRSQTVGSQIEFMIPADSNGGNMWGQSRIITVAGNTSSDNATGMMILGTRRYFDKLGTGGHWYYGDDLTINGSGNIGISTTTPAAKLDVNGDTNIAGNLNVTGTITGGAAMTGTLNAGNVSAGTFGSNTGNGNFALMGNFGIGTATPNDKLEISGGSLRLGSGDGYNSAIIKDGNGNTMFRGIRLSSGYWNDANNATAFQVGSTNDNIVFTTALTGVAPRILMHTNSFNINNSSNSNPPIGMFDVSNGNTKLFNILSSGNIGIGTTNPSEAKLVISAGTGMALKAYGNGIFTGTLQTQTGSDFAEEFTTSKDLEQGTVVVMDDNGHKSVRPCNKSYDKTVVGIVSNNPSIIAGRVTSEHKAIIAMMGVVKVKVVDINGTIAKGDLLTTSGVYGYAMKAAKEKPGTIIGKALEDLNSKSGQINVLVNLQ